jgi:2-polyprenyl-3-methyl-5-hydroxy-6-metoxy-1,4-benzoquinol methylase
MGFQPQHVKEIVAAYDDPIVRAYCLIRFQILNQRFLTEVGQYLPRSGRVLDIGCGFGLFSLYYSMLNPELKIVGIDKNASRIEQARRAAARLGIDSVRYEVGDVTEYSLNEQFDGAYMLDIVHHVPKQEVQPLISRISERVAPGACVLIKDIDSRPAYKRWFTWALDKLMDFRTPVNYWPPQELKPLLEKEHFQVFHHEIRDILPYPHILYICRRLPAAVSSAQSPDLVGAHSE